MHAALHLRVNMLHLCVCQVTHHINIMRRKIERDTNIANARRKWAEPSCMEMKYPPKLSCNEMPFHLDNCWVKAFDMPDSKLGRTKVSKLNKCVCLLNGARHWFFEKHIDASVEQIRCDFEMQLGGYNHGNKIGMGPLNHLPVVCVASHIESTHSTLQVRLVCFCDTYELNLLLVEISKYA